MFADIAEARCSKQGIGDRVQYDIRVAVAGEATRMRDFDSAEHDWTRAGEGVNVEAGPRAGREPAGQPLLGSVEIGRKRQLFESGVAFDRRDLHVGGANDGGFVGGGGAYPLLISRAKSGKLECLRRLHAREGRPIDGIAQGLLHARERVADR